MFKDIIFQKSEALVKITLNRPQTYHALSLNLLDELTAAITQAGDDDHVRAVVITGEGDKAFCSGADLRETMSSGKTAGEILKQHYEPLILAIRNIPKPVIARLNGLAVGAGCSLALACDVTIAREDTYLSQLFVQIGLMPDAGSMFFMPRLIGAARTFELISTGRKVYAPEAAAIGLITKSVSAAQLDEEVQRFVQYYLHAPTCAIAAMKQALNQSFQSDFQQMLDIERAGQSMLFGTSDAQEGIAAFSEKRLPNFKGR